VLTTRIDHVGEIEQRFTAAAGAVDSGSSELAEGPLTEGVLG